MIHTKRLVLRQWKEQDIPTMIAMNASPEVMTYFPTTYSEEQTRTFIATCADCIENQGWGFWAVEITSTSTCIGLVGINKVPEDMPINGSIEIGWRLAKPYWGMGYATEAAIASLDYAFNQLEQHEVVAFTATQNLPSQKVMKRIGMQLEPETFLHPRVPSDSSLKEHVLYRITKDQFLKGKYNE